MTDKTTNERPPGFDAALVAYLPQLRQRAQRIVRGAAEELLQDTVTMMLEKAHQCRMETFKTWAQIVMLRASSNHKRMRNAEMRTGMMVPESAALAIRTEPNQEHHVALVQALDALAGIRHGDLVVSEAMGDGINVDLGRTVYARLRFRRQSARNRLIKRMAA